MQKTPAMQFGILGSGSWATALVKLLTDNGHSVQWWVRNTDSIAHIQKRLHNPHYLSSVNFPPGLLTLNADAAAVAAASHALVVATPSAYVTDVISTIPADVLKQKLILSAVKGILPDQNMLLNEYLYLNMGFPPEQYFAIMGPCHAEEVAKEKLSYLTFSGLNEGKTSELAAYFATEYLRTVVNTDLNGVQYAAILKNIYAVGAGMAHGLDYGDNFLSVLIANSADEMAGFLKKTGVPRIEVGVHEEADPISHRKRANYAASVYLGDLLVTCYSLYSRNRTFGNMIGKGYSVKAAQLEMNMVAEGYNASKCIYLINEKIGAEMPIASAIYEVLWNKKSAAQAFASIEDGLL